MADVFTLGQEGSRSAFVSSLNDLLDQGQGLLDDLEQKRLNTLLEFNRCLSAMNGRRQRANRAESVGILGTFHVSDFIDIDQTNTTATVRADSQSVSLKERQTPVDTTIASVAFTASKGSIQVLDADKFIYSVSVPDVSIPTGQFDVQLASPLNLNLIVFDIVSMPSAPQITVSVSGDGVVYISADQTFRNGYRVNSWFPETVVKYIRIVITPTHPDTLNGDSYSFGLTSFEGITSQYHLRSELLTQTITVSPKTSSFRFSADEDDNIVYFLSINGQAFFEAHPGDVISIPGVTTITPVSVHMNGSGILAHTLPAGVYENSLLITEQRLVMSVNTDVPLIIVKGLSTSDSRIARMTGEYVGLNGTQLSIVRGDNTFDTGRTFTISYSYGPASITVQLKVRLLTSDKSVTPTFHGATLEEV